VAEARKAKISLRSEKKAHSMASSQKAHLLVIGMGVIRCGGDHDSFADEH